VGFLFSFVFEFGTTFVVIRNGIFWGLTLGVFAGSYPGNLLGLLLIAPHLVLEASSYFVSSIAGGVLSKAVVEEKIESERFYSLFTQVIALLLVSILLVVLAAGVETIVFNHFCPEVAKAVFSNPLYHSSCPVLPIPGIRSHEFSPD